VVWWRSGWVVWPSDDPVVWRHDAGQIGGLAPRRAM